MSIAPIQTAPRPAARPPASEPPPSGEGDFAQLMALQAPADEPPPAGRPDEGRQARNRQAARGTTRAATTEAPRESPDVAKSPREAADPARRPDEDAAPLDPALAQWLQSLHRPEVPAEAPATTTESEPEADAAGVMLNPRGLPHARPAAQPDEAADVQAAAGARSGHGPTAARSADKGAREAVPALDAPAARASEDAPAATAALPHEPAPVASPTGFALPAGFEPVSTASPGTSPVAAEAPVLAVPMPVPLESPEFAQAFGLEISTLARDGIQQAELHLNPAEMGPVSVQIALDGEKARIDFGAQAAATRAAIEASLPELAAALRDAGLTLAGGGVSQHPGQRGDGRSDGEPGGARAGSRERADAGAAAPSRPVLRSRAGPGGVDLYA
ncbi:MAG: flagellar hook-length control protein FliK [Piscinibacter sp.]|uniref:flagellar hook-length control protein FliK n=1 Tax=Piscinibacter sp. TaxID=1903157 RepID=UPI003D0DA21A